MHFMADQEVQTGLIWPLKWPAEDKFHHSPCSLSKAKIELLHDIRVNSIIDLIETCLNLLEHDGECTWNHSVENTPIKVQGPHATRRSWSVAVRWHSVASEAENHAHVS